MQTQKKIICEHQRSLKANCRRNLLSAKHKSHKTQPSDGICMPGSYSRLLGVVGKPNTGKSTFFSAATLATAEIANYPFTTIKPNRGVGYVRTRCVHEDFKVQDNPRNSVCLDGSRLVPVE